MLKRDTMDWFLVWHYCKKKILKKKFKKFTIACHMISI